MQLALLMSELKRRNVVRVAGVYVVTSWALFQIAKTIFDTLRFPEWTAPLALVLLCLGLPIAAILAWALERGPDGHIRRASPAAGAVGGRGDLMDWALIAALLTVGVLTVVSMARTGGVDVAPAPAPAVDRSVAVLPFAAYSAGADSEYFADGLTEEIINSLAQISGLKVAGRTSAFYFKGKNEDLRLVGRKLGVAHVVEGSVRRDGDDLRVTAQLITVKDGFHLWSKTYDRKLDDTLAIQTEIANAVAQALKISIEVGAPPQNGQRPAEAVALELTARAHLRRWGLEDLQTARAEYEQLTALEPNNAGAYAGYAQATMLLAQNHLALDFETSRRVSEAAIERALKIDPNCVEAWLARAFVGRVLSIRVGEGRYLQQAEAAARRALELSPRHPEALSIYAAILGDSGRAGAAVDMARRSLAVDPLNRVSQMVLAKQLAKLGRLDEAAQQLRNVAGLYPDFDEAKQGLGLVLTEQGRLAEAEPWLVSGGGADGRDGATALQLANVYLNLGLPQDADRVLAKVTAPATAAGVAEAARLGARGDYAGVTRVGEARAAADEDPIWSSIILIGALAQNDVARAGEELRKEQPQIFLPEPAVATTDLEVPLYAAHVLIAEGDRPQARRILNRILAVTEPRPKQYVPVEWRIARMRAFAELGEVDRAIAELQAATASGWRTLFYFEDWVWLDRHPTTANLQGDPRFQAVVRDIRADMARQREAVVAMRR